MGIFQKNDQEYDKGNDSKLNEERKHISKQCRIYNSTKELDDNKKDLQLGTRNIILLAGMASMNFFASACFSLPGPFFPGEAMKKGASPTVIGLIFGTFPLMISVFSPIFGYFVSNIGVKFMFVSGSMVCGACAVLFGCLDKCPNGMIFIVMCFLCRSVEGIGAAAFYTAGYVIIAHQFKSNIGKVYSILETCYSLGLMIGPPFGGALYQIGGFSLPFGAVGGAVVLNGIICSLFLPCITDVTKSERGQVTTLMRSVPFLIVGFSLFVGVFSIAFIEPVLEPHLRKFGLNSLEIGLVFLIDPCTYGLTMFTCGWLIDGFNIELTILMNGSLLGIASYLMLGPGPFLTFIPSTLWVVILSLCLIGVSLGCAYGPALKYLVCNIKKIGMPDNMDTLGMVSGYLSFCTSTGALLGPITGGLIVNYVGFEWGVCVCSGLSFLTALAIAVYSMYERCSGIKENNDR